MAVMFSNSKSSIPTNGHIIEFKAGRTVLEPGSAESKKRVVPENKKGLVYVKQSNDQLIHFCWKDRETGALVDDLIIFPGDTDFKEVKECVDGKVYMLKFKTSKDMRLYWLQEGGSEIEKDLVQKVTDALNKPPPTRTPARGGASERLINFPSGLNVGSDDFSGALGNLDHQQLLSLLQTFGGNGVDVSLTGDATTGEAQAETSSTPQPDGQAVKLQNDLSKILSNLNKTPKKQALASLADAIANTTVQETSKNHGDRLKPLIATTENPADTELEETLRTPQLRQAADSFGNALQTGQLGPVLEQFGVSGGVLEAANKGDLLEFAKQLTVQESGQPTQSGAPASQPPVKKESDDDESKEPEPKKSRPDLEDMDVD